MAKWLFVVESNCADPAREAEFNQWYERVHIPDVLGIPGFVRATRYENLEPGEGKGKFLATYEIESEDVNKTMKELTDCLPKWQEIGRFSDLFVRVSRGLYRHLSSLPK
ncbi:hypothetical protein ACFLWY_02250 [Chloroflexota bacterium]